MATTAVAATEWEFNLVFGHFKYAALFFIETCRGEVN
jgi:hypothetical protein